MRSEPATALAIVLAAGCAATSGPSAADGGTVDSSKQMDDARVDPPDADGAAPSDRSGAEVGGAEAAGPEAPLALDGPPPACRAAPGYLCAIGARLLDTSGREARLTGLSWFGMESSSYAPWGLQQRSLASLLDQVKGLGYNALRIPFCSQMLDAGARPTNIDFGKNPSLMGADPLRVLDAIVAAAGARGLKIILDRHRPDSGAQSPLWYTDRYGEQRWIDDWKMLAARYRGDRVVVGVDLHNEPHDAASWGDGSMATDWRLAAERAGNAVLAANPDLLVIVQGVHKTPGAGYWWGGNLREAKAHPVRLAATGRLVYSTHDYPASVYMQPWFSDPAYPANLPEVWRANWGYLVEEGIAPVWIGEFGTRLETDLDRKWLRTLADYIAAGRFGFAFWSLNPNSTDTGGVLKDDWQTVQQAKQDILQPLLAPLVP